MTTEMIVAIGAAIAAVLATGAVLTVRSSRKSVRQSAKTGGINIGGDYNPTKKP